MVVGWQGDFFLSGREVFRERQQRVGAGDVEMLELLPFTLVWLLVKVACRLTKCADGFWCSVVKGNKEKRKKPTLLSRLNGCVLSVEVVLHV